MATPSAEVIVVPEVDRSALKRMNQKMSENFKAVAQNAERHLEKHVAKGIIEGGRRGAMRLQRVLKSGRGLAGRAGGAVYDELGGARGLAVGVGGVALAGLISTIDRASQGRDLIAGLLGESTAAGQLAGAKSAGLSSSQFGQFSAQLQNIGGATDQQAIADLLQDINVRVQESVAEGGGQLEQFSRYTGQDRINRVLASISQQTSEQQQQTLDAMGISAEDGRALLAVIQEAGRNRNADQALQFLNTSNAAEGAAIGDNLMSEAELSKEYRRQQIEFNNEMREKLLNNIDKGKIGSLFAQRQTEVDKQAALLENFEANQVLAKDATEKIESVMSAMNETTLKIYDAVLQGVSLVQNREDNWAANLVFGEKPVNATPQQTKHTADFLNKHTAWGE